MWHPIPGTPVSHGLYYPEETLLLAGEQVFSLA